MPYFLKNFKNFINILDVDTKVEREAQWTH